MRAWQVTKVGEPRDVLSLAEVPLPEPGPGMVRVRVEAAGIGLPDVLMCRDAYALTPKRPFTPGQELVGVVTACGDGAQNELGARVMGVSGFVFGHGGFAEEALAFDDFCLPVPQAMEAETAAGFVIPFHTAYIALVQRAGLQAGETLLVLGGAGGTGTAAIQLGRARGARVIATASGPEKTAFCRELGANEVLDRRSDEIAPRVRELTNGRGVDVVYDPVGGEAFEQATHCIAQEGRILLVGFASGSWGNPVGSHLAYNNYSVLGVIPTGYDRAFKQRAHGELLELYRERAIRVPIHRAYPFDDLPAALQELAGGGVMGKLVLQAPER